MLTASLVNKYLPDATHGLPSEMSGTNCHRSANSAGPFLPLSSINVLHSGSQRRGEKGSRIGGYGTPNVPATLDTMARWPRHVWTSIFTYGTVFVLFPLLCLLAHGWVRGWIF